MVAKKIVVALAVLAVELALVAPAAMGDIPGPSELAERFEPRSPGTENPMTLFFGPFTIPPGQDMNRVTADLPPFDGFITAIAPGLVDATTGGEPSDLEMHIHHAHWFRVSDDPNEEYYALNLAWVFGTGEEKTQGSLNDRSRADPDGPSYGLFIPGGEPQALIFMLHNKLASARTLYITLEVSFVYGNAEEIRSATGCPDLREGESCRAGETFRPLTGKLWGSTFDVPRDADGDGVYVHPVDIPEGDPTRLATDDLGRFFTASFSGTLVATAGHMHQNGMEVVLANLGPAGSGCARDLDRDGFPGVTLLRSRKMDRNVAAWPHSEDYQMGASKAGFRAPIREGDRITQFGVYANADYASYEAMSFVGIYVDRAAPPAPVAQCTLATLAPTLVGTEEGPASESVLNHAWEGLVEPLCGEGLGPACDAPLVPRAPGLETPVVHVAGFLYAPGDQNVAGPAGDPPRVAVGESLTFVNDDVAAGVRHTVTSCAFPCNGPYVANYPQPDGLFDSGKLGNLDYIDGGLTGDDTVPVWETPDDLAPGVYTYYCRVHPFMRGAFEVLGEGASAISAKNLI